MPSKEADFINTCFPIEQVEVYKNGCYKVIRKSKLQGNYLPKGRSNTVSFTKKSLQNLIFTINATDVVFKSMITLTYPQDFPANGATVKEDLRVYTQFLARRFKTNVLWFLEFQKRGAPHFHILTEVSEITPEMRVSAVMQWVKRVTEADWFLACFREFSTGEQVEFHWQEYKTEVMKIANFNMRREFWELAKDKDGMMKYAAKYASKMYQKEVPDKYTEVGRFWGCSKNVKPSPKITVDACEEDIRRLLEANNHKAKDWEVIPKLIFNANKTKA